MVHSIPMTRCPSWQQLATKRDGYDQRGRQRYGCCPCRRDFTADSPSAFSGYRWLADVILTAVRWAASSPRSAAHVPPTRVETGFDEFM